MPGLHHPLAIGFLNGFLYGRGFFLRLRFGSIGLLNRINMLGSIDLLDRINLLGNINGFDRINSFSIDSRFGIYGDGLLCRFVGVCTILLCRFALMLSRFWRRCRRFQFRIGRSYRGKRENHLFRCDRLLFAFG